MKPLRCELTGKEITSGYWSPSSGFVYDRKEIEEILKRDERDPLSHRALKLTDLVPIHHEFDIDSFASSVGILYREIEDHRERDIKNEREIKALRRDERYGARAAPSNEGLLKKTYEAKLENLEKEKDKEINELLSQISDLKLQLQNAEEDHQRKRTKMMDAVREREDYWQRRYDDKFHNAALRRSGHN